VSENCKLEWTDASWNPVGGCRWVSPGCANCYAAKQAGELHTALRVPLYDGVADWVQGRWEFNDKLTVLPPAHQGWLFPLEWKGARSPVMRLVCPDGPVPSLIFVVDRADLFVPHRPKPIIDQVVSTMAWSNHIGQFLTKFPAQMAAYFLAPRPEATVQHWQSKFWLGFSAENQQWFDVRWRHMRKLAQAGWTVFVNVGPVLGPVELPADFLALGSRAWCIFSGEQGKRDDCRPMAADWARALRDQSAAHGVPFYLSQMWCRGPIPGDLFVRQFPRLKNTNTHS
jgi:protein gp37